MQSKAWSRMSLCSGENQTLQNSGGLNITQRCENRQETQVSTPIGHSGPHDLWGHQANIGQVSPSSFSLFHATRRGEKFGFSSSHPLFPSNSSRGAQRCSFQLISPRKPPGNPSYQLMSSDAMSCRRTSNSNWAAQPNQLRRQEPHNQQDDFTELRTAQQPFSPFRGRVTPLGLIIILG